MQIDKAALRASCLKVSAQKMNGKLRMNKKIYYFFKEKYYIIFKYVRNRAEADGKADASQGREQGRIV